MTYSFFKNFAPACALIAVPAGLHAQETFSTPSGLSTLTFYGQVSPAITSFDDGEDTTTTITDNSSSNTRVGFDMDVDYGDAGSLRLKFETALGFRQSGSISQNFTPQVWDYELENLRKLELIWTADYGVLSFGQGSMASDGAAGSDFSGVGLTNTVTVADPVGAFLFRQTDGALSDVAVGDAFRDLDGARRGRKRVCRSHEQRRICEEFSDAIQPCVPRQSVPAGLAVLSAVCLERFGFNLTQRLSLFAFERSERQRTSDSTLNRKL